MHIDPEHWKEGLVVRSPNWLGDLVMTFPALMQLKKLLPEYCELAVMCPANLAPILETLDVVDEIVPLADAHAFPKYDEVESLVHRHFGAGILFNNSLRDAVAMRLIGIRPLVGTAARGRSFLLRETISFPKRLDRQFNPPHQAVRCSQIAQMLGAEPWDGHELPHMTIDISPESFAAAHDLPTFPADPLMVVAPGAAYGDAKRWDAACYHEVARFWIEQRGGVVIFLGTKAESMICDDCMNGLPADRTMNFAGKTSLQDLMFLLRSASVCVANDSGIMHLGAALRTRGIAIFGSTDPVATGPISDTWTVLQQKEPCAPCFKRVCPLGTRQCFRNITPSMVISLL